MTTPWIRTHARIGNRWDLLVGNAVFADYRTAIEVRRLEDRIRQYAKSMTWDEATARAAEEEKDHRWKPLSRKSRKQRSSRTSTTVESQPSPQMAPPSPPVPPQATEPGPVTPERSPEQIGLPMAP